MKKMIRIFGLGAALLFIFTGCAQEEPFEQVESDVNDGQTGQMEEDKEGEEEVIWLAEIFIEELSNDEYERAAEKFDEMMEEQLGAEDLAQLWESVEEQLGPYEDHEYGQIEIGEDDSVVLIDGIFQNAEATFQVTVNENQEIAGFYIQ